MNPGDTTRVEALLGRPVIAQRRPGREPRVVYQFETAASVWGRVFFGVRVRMGSMTATEKQNEIAVRITRLSDLRAEIAAARSKLQDGLYRLESAAQAINRDSVAKGPSWEGKHRNPEPWPSKAEVEEMNKAMVALKSEASHIIQDLTDLGVDSNLFKINGGG